MNEKIRDRLLKNLGKLSLDLTLAMVIAESSPEKERLKLLREKTDEIISTIAWAYLKVDN